jgi:sucrose-6-phosphate hydrolase SacC (GH32 family)
MLDATPASGAELWRPQFHFTPRKNWINDPNGLIFHNGEYHLFYQYNPFGDQWGHMSWGHAVSADLLHWQELPVAIAEDERASIFSGSIVIDANNSAGFGAGALVAIYTGCLRRHEGGQAQELAFSTDRGRTWTKYEHNPVLDLALREFRDPKVFWHAPTASWVMAVVLPEARTVLFYASHDLEAWTELSRFADDLAGQGIWECPDLFELPVDGEATSAWVLKVDAFEGHPSGGSGARLFFGLFDGTRFTAEPADAPVWADHGADFCAALSWAGLHDRAVWVAWMNCHRYAKHPPTQPWRGSMTLPRELSLRRGASGRRCGAKPRTSARSHSPPPASSTRCCRRLAASWRSSWRASRAATGGSTCGSASMSARTSATTPRRLPSTSIARARALCRRAMRLMSLGAARAASRRAACACCSTLRRWKSSPTTATPSSPDKSLRATTAKACAWVQRRPRASPRFASGPAAMERTSPEWLAGENADDAAARSHKLRS